MHTQNKSVLAELKESDFYEFYINLMLRREILEARTVFELNHVRRYMFGGENMTYENGLVMTLKRPKTLNTNGKNEKQF